MCEHAGIGVIAQAPEGRRCHGDRRAFRFKPRTFAAHDSLKNGCAVDRAHIVFGRVAGSVHGCDAARGTLFAEAGAAVSYLAEDAGEPAVGRSAPATSGRAETERGVRSVAARQRLSRGQLGVARGVFDGAA